MSCLLSCPLSCLYFCLLSFIFICHNSFHLCFLLFLFSSFLLHCIFDLFCSCLLFISSTKYSKPTLVFTHSFFVSWSLLWAPWIVAKVSPYSILAARFPLDWIRAAVCQCSLIPIRLRQFCCYAMLPYCHNAIMPLCCMLLDPLSLAIQFHCSQPGLSPTLASCGPFNARDCNKLPIGFTILPFIHFTTMKQ